MSFVRTVLEVQ